MRVAVLGATSGIAEACLRQWAERGCDLVLVARDQARLDASAADLRVRGAGEVVTAAVDIGTADGVERGVKEATAHGPLDVALIAFGVMPEQAESDQSLDAAHAVLDVTGTLNVLALHLLALRLLDQGSGTVAVLGSVAGDRGRKSNYLYGSAKAMVATAAEGLQHRTAGTGVSVVLVKPGPTRTAMTEHLDGARRMTSPDVVAELVVNGVERGTPVVYAPGRWRLIMTVVRMLPRRIFHRTNL